MHPSLYLLSDWGISTMQHSDMQYVAVTRGWETAMYYDKQESDEFLEVGPVWLPPTWTQSGSTSPSSSEALCYLPGTRTQVEASRHQQRLQRPPHFSRPEFATNWTCLSFCQPRSTIQRRSNLLCSTLPRYVWCNRQLHQQLFPICLQFLSSPPHTFDTVLLNTHARTIL
jgi:hypothetical protein